MRTHRISVILLYASACITLSSCSDVLESAQGIQFEDKGYIRFFTEVINDAPATKSAAPNRIDSLGIVNGECGLYRYSVGRQPSAPTPTKGTPINSASELTSDLYLNAYYIDEEEGTLNYITGEKTVRRSGIYQTVNKYGFPLTDSGSHVNYIAAYPYELFKSHIQNHDRYFTFDYDYFDDMEETDLMVGVGGPYTSSAQTPSLSFNHILSSVKFVGGGNHPSNMHISKVGLTGIYDTGSYFFDAINKIGYWDALSTTYPHRDIDVYCFNINIGCDYGDRRDFSDELFILPQTCPEDSYIYLEGDCDGEPFDLVFSLEGMRFEPGVAYEFRMNAPSLYYLTVGDMELKFAPAYGPYIVSSQYLTNIPSSFFSSESLVVNQSGDTDLIKITEVLQHSDGTDGQVRASVDYYNFTSLPWVMNYTLVANGIESNTGSIVVSPHDTPYAEFLVNFPEYIFIGQTKQLSCEYNALAVPQRYLNFWRYSGTSIEVSETGLLTGLDNGITDVSVDFYFPNSEGNEYHSTGSVKCFRPVLESDKEKVSVDAKPDAALTNVASTVNSNGTLLNVSDNEFIVTSRMFRAEGTMTQTITFQMPQAGLLMLEVSSGDTGVDNVLQVSKISNTLIPLSDVATSFIGAETREKHVLAYYCTAGPHSLKISATGMDKCRIESKIYYKKSAMCTITSRDSWQVEDKPDWVLISPEAGGAPNISPTITPCCISAVDNETSVQKSGYITFKTTDGSNLTTKVLVSQSSSGGISIGDSTDGGDIFIDF